MSLLNGYITSSQVLSPKSFRQKEVVPATFANMARSIAKIITRRKKELPNEDCLFILSCKVYKFKEYVEAHPDTFEKEGK